MLSPNLNKVLEELSKNKEDDAFSEEKGPSVSVHKLTGQAGVFYEKLRYFVDYKEEHTIRRSAIERILKRKLLVKIKENFGLSLLKELVGSGYLPNNKVPEGFATSIQIIVNKYLLLESLVQVEHSTIISLLASEIEGFLYPQLINNLIVDYFYTTVAGSIRYGGSVSQDDLNIETYIGCRRALFEDDQDTLLYAVLIKYLPNLATLSNDIEIKNIAPKFLQAVSLSEKNIEDPLGWKMALKLKNYSIYFSVIKEIIKKQGALSGAIFADHSRLEVEIKEILTEKYWQLYYLVNKSGTRAFTYIFLTKVILALALEFPYEKFILHSTDYFALGTNIVFHPVLLLVIVKTINWPGPENTEFIISGVKAIVQNENVKPIYIKQPINNILLQITYGILYTVLFSVSFGLILWGLKSLDFNIISIVLFIFFLTFISYFGFRIRYNAKKWTVARDEEGVLNLLWNLFTTPIVRTGRWLSRRFSSINIFVFFMDFILETPFKFLLGTFDSFILFIKEERGDPY